MIEFFRMMAGAKDVVIARTIPAWKAAEPLPKPHDFEKFANEGYRKNVLIYACIRTLADCVAKAPPVVKTDPEGEVVEKGPMVDLLWEPNPTDTRFSLVERIVMHLNVAGNAYVWKRRAKNRKVGELYALRPDRVSIKVKKSGDLDGYVYKLDAESKSEFLPADDVIHMLLPDPLDDFYGLSPIAVMARYGDLDTQAVDYLRAFFLNGGAPAGLLKLKNRAPAAERARIQAQWKEMYGTHTGWHDIAVLDAEAEYEELGSRPEKLTMTAMFDTTETRICSAFGVPPIVVQVRVGLENNVWGNYKEAVKSMWNETVIPQYDRIGDALTRGLVGDEFGEGIEIAFDYSKVDALQEDQDSKRKFALEGWDKGLITLNEARETAGLDPIKGEEGGERKKAPDPVAPGPFDAKTGQPLPKPGEKQGIEIDAEDLDEYLGTGRLRLHRPKAQGLPETSGGPVETLRGKSDEPLWRAFRGQIAKQEDVMVDRFVRLIAASRRQMNVNAVARKVRDGEEATMKAMELAETLRAVSILSGKSIHDAHGVGGAIAARHLSLLMQLGDAPKETFAFKFDAADPRAAKWISERKKWLADRFGEDSHEAVSGILQQSFTDGVGPLATAKRLRQHLGLTAQDSGALLKLEGKLAARGLSAAQIQKRLAEVSKLEMAGGAAYLSELIVGMPRMTSIDGWAQIVKDKSTLRRIQATGERMAAATTADDAVAVEVLNQAIESLETATEAAVATKFQEPVEDVNEAIQALEDLKEGREIRTPTGYVDLDRLLLGGALPGDLMIVAARTSMGKTTLLMNIGENMAASGKKVAFFSAEMTRKQITTRRVCAQSRVPYAFFLNRRIIQ